MSLALNPALLPPGTGTDQPGGRTPAVGGPAPVTGVPTPAEGGASGPSFADVLKDATGRTGEAGSGGSTGRPLQADTSVSASLRFSKHALERVQRRGIALDPATLGRLQEGVGRAAGKGSRDSIVLVDGTAFVVSVNNRTVDYRGRI